MTGVITPSSLWQGERQPGSKWTVQQVAEIMKAGRDPLTVPSATILRRPKSNGIGNWTMPPAPVRVDLPRLAITRDGRRAKVITPAGAVQWMEIVRG